MERQAIYTKDIQVLLGRSERYARNLIHKMKLKFNKEPHQYITIEEFCEYTGLSLEKVTTLINKR